ncbi:extracellular solute-binding protein [Streptacidiphilus cavernicola]|uniref:Extracellular solute-binding protein n=1 Tax=Streptacidiphilus cavernicola TaxID=3342716 RepID=A0ABV6W3P9_9ACTN
MTSERLTSPRVRRTAALLLAATVGLTAAACGSSSSKTTPKSTADGKVTISIDCAPPTSKPVPRKQWFDDIATFEKQNPNITVKSIDTFPCETPALFTAALTGHTEPDVFYTYFTDKQQVLDSGQAADISSYVNTSTVPSLNDIAPSVLDGQKSDGKLYGLPRTNYAMGIIINRKLFTQAGLNPDQPPTTWAEVAADAAKIQALGNGVNGYGEYSAGNNGGWHFVAEMDALGAPVVSADGKKAAFNTDQGKQVLQNLHDLRFKDNAMGKTQLYKWGDLQKQMAAGKLGMYIAAPDDITYMVQTFKSQYSDFGMGPIPGTDGPAKGTLAGGDDMMFNIKDTPAQIKAGIKLVNFLYLTSGQGQFNYERAKGSGQAVGLPEPEFYTGASLAADNSLKAANSTMPVDNYKPFVDAAVPGVNEPGNAQDIYKVLDTAMASALTNPNANIPQLLSTAEAQVNQVLANK